MNNQLDKDIEIAFKARGLREAMREWDDAAQKTKQRIIRLVKTFTPIAMAAMLAGVFFVPFGWTVSNVGSNFTSENLAQYSSYASMKGTQDDAAAFIADAYVALEKKEYKEASGLSQTAMKMLQGTNDPYELDMLHDAEWYNALANLSRKQLWYVMKAKKDLKRIASNPGKHQTDAEELLQKLKE